MHMHKTLSAGGGRVKPTEKKNRDVGFSNLSFACAIDVDDDDVDVLALCTYLGTYLLLLPPALYTNKYSMQWLLCFIVQFYSPSVRLIISVHHCYVRTLLVT